MTGVCIPEAELREDPEPLRMGIEAHRFLDGTEVRLPALLLNETAHQWEDTSL